MRRGGRDDDPLPLRRSPRLGPSPADLGPASHDPRSLRILAKSIYKELRQVGLQEKDVMAVAGELLSLVAGEVKDRREAAPGTPLGASPASSLGNTLGNGPANGG